MMRTLKTFAAILALVLFTTSVAFAANYPPGLPKNFEKYPQKFCEREAPTAIYLKTYASIEDDGLSWIVQIFGKDKKNLFVLELRRSIMDFFATSGRVRVWLQDDWQEPKDEREANFMINRLFTKEEHAFFGECPAK